MLKGTIRNRPARRLAAVIVILLSGVLASCDSSRGREAVKELCERDGGFTISETVNARGFLNLDEKVSCSSCMEAVGMHGFEYVDAQLDEHRKQIMYKQPGYYRISRSIASDPRCDIYLNAVSNNYFTPPERFGLQPDECFAIELLPARPEGVIYYRQFRKVTANNGTPLCVWEQVIADEPSGKSLATNRDYLFTSRWTRWGDMSGGGGRIDAHCENPENYTIYSLRFLERVLRDPSKPLQ